MFDKTGTQVVSYTYDTWGKLISTTGSLASTVGAVNPYLYRGYRYDTETGLYYLQSRYYNPDWGRFINADAIGGKVGELLSHNMFAYCKNNPVNMLDADGYRPEFSGTGHDTGDDLAVSLAIMNHRYDYSTGYIRKSFDYKSSAVKGTKSGTIDKVGETVGGAIIKEKKVWKSTGILTVGEYVSNLRPGVKLAKKAVGLAGTIGFTGWDVGNDLYNHEYYSAGVDLASAIVGIGAGVVIGAFIGMISMPAIAAGVLVFGLSVAAGVAIDKYATYRKDVHYGR